MLDINFTERRNIMGDNILKETISILKDKYGDELDKITVERAVFGLFFTGVKLSNGDAGVSYTPLKALSSAVCCPSSAATMPRAGKLTGMPVSYYFEDMFKGGELKKTFGIAVINALTHAYEENYDIEYGKDPVDHLGLEEGSFTVVVGALVPYIKYLKKNKRDFAILELDPSVLKQDELQYHVSGKEADEAVSKADYLIITGVTLINDTLEDILSKAKDDCEIAVVGPTISMYPEPLFKRGVEHIGGVKVTDADRLLDVLSEGGSGYHFFGKSAEKITLNKE